MVSVDYAYYTASYYGNLIPSSDFNRLVKRAEPYVSARTFGQADNITSTDTLATKVKDTLCAVAEIIKTHTSDDGLEHGAVTSENVGGTWSRTYAQGTELPTQIEAIIYDKIYIMLSNTDLLYGGDSL